MIKTGILYSGDFVDDASAALVGVTGERAMQLDDGAVLSYDALVVAKDRIHEKRRARRTQAELAGFTHVVGQDSYRLDSDRDSILRISNAANAALTATITQSPWSTVWACADGQSLTLDAPGMLAMQISLAVHGQACHTRSQALAAEIEAAESLEALAAIDTNSGWPA